MSTLIDTSAFYALLDRDDENHSKAAKAWPEMLDAGETLVTHNYILVETFALLQRRLGLEAVKRFHEDVVPLLSIEFVNADLHRLAVTAFLAASRRALSLVDHTTFEVMRDLGIKTAFAFDSHFKEQGFRLLP